MFGDMGCAALERIVTAGAEVKDLFAHQYRVVCEKLYRVLRFDFSWCTE